MKPLERNIGILEHIVGYCGQIEETIRRFGNDYGVFSTDVIYRNAAALCNWPESWRMNFVRSIQARPGGRFAVCGILWRTVMALLIRRSPGKF